MYINHLICIYKRVIVHSYVRLCKYETSRSRLHEDCLKIGCTMVYRYNYLHYYGHITWAHDDEPVYI